MRYLFLLFLSTPLFADEGVQHSYFEEFINMMMTLVFVLGLAIVTLLFIRKMMRSRAKQLNLSTGIKVLEKRVMSQKAALYLIDILGKGVVIAESPAGIQVVTQFPEGISVEALLEAQAGEELPKKERFQEVMKRLFSKKPKSENKSAT